MTTKPRLRPDHPLIVQAFAGIFKSSAKVFFKINPDGTHKKIPVFMALDGINITHDCKMEIIKAFPFEHLAYFSQRMKAALVAEEANRKPKLVRTVATDCDEEEIADEPEADGPSGGSKKNPEYFLVAQNNGYHGCFSAREGEVIAMFKTKAEAEAFVKEQLHGGWNFKAFYGKASQSE